MSLALLVGPANAGKVARLLDRYLAEADRQPVLIVPNRSDVERVERDLLIRSPGLLGGWIGTFDDLFERIVRAHRGAEVRPRIKPAQRALLVSRLVVRVREGSDGAALGQLESARFPGFADALGEAIADLGAALVEPTEIEGPLRPLYVAYRDELERLGLWDREQERRHAADLVAGEFSAWDGAPVFAYGFEDLTGAQWALVEALAGRADVTVSLPYEPGRAVFASLARTADDLTRLANGTLEELPAQSWYDAPALAHLERTLFADDASPASEPPRIDGAVRFFEAAGPRAALELVGEEVLALIRGGTPADEIALVCPSLDGWRAPLATAFGALGIPYALEGRIALGRTAFGHALVSLLRYAWLDARPGASAAGRGELFTFLRSPYSGLPRSRADFVEGRLRGRGVSQSERVEEETTRLLGHGIPALDALRAAEDPVDAVRSLATSMLRAAYGLESPPVSEDARLDLRAYEALRKLLVELEGWRKLGGDVGRDDLVRAIGRAHVSLATRREPGRVAVADLLRARTRRFAAVFVLGLEEGVLPRRGTESPFLPDAERRELDERRGRRLARPDTVARDRYLFYTACTRPWGRLTLVREASSDDGRPREPSPFYEEVRARFAPDDVARWTRRRALSELTWDVDRAPTERERLRATAAIAAAGEEGEARALARANGWERRMERALGAFTRHTRLTHPDVLRELGETARFSVTELETFGNCSSMWLFDRVVDPKAIDAELDVRLRGGVAHQALYRFYTGIPKRLGTDRVEPAQLDDALAFLGDCVREALAGQVRIDLSDVERLELEGTLMRDLEYFVRQEIELGFPLVPRRFEVLFGTPGAPVELQRGLDLGGFTVSGKIDRIDIDPMSARGIVQDYKSGRTAHSAAQIESAGLLQIPLYVLALRDLVGIEPLGGLYRALAGPREARGLVLASASAEVPHLKRADYLDDEEFWDHVEAAKDRARTAVGRIRSGDVRHDPRGGRCPTWCERWTMCRIGRA
jgi:ATP-dependent helicase/DNAse subunit B